MNEKLTPEQREWILDKLKEVSLELQDGNVSWTSVNIHRFEQILTAHTAEDECNHVWYGRPSIGDTVCGKCGIQEVHTAEDEYNASKYGTFQPAQQIWKDWMMSHARSIGTDFEEWFRVRYAAEDDDPAIEAKNEFERGIIL